MSETTERSFGVNQVMMVLLSTIIVVIPSLLTGTVLPGLVALAALVPVYVGVKEASYKWDVLWGIGFLGTVSWFWAPMFQPLVYEFLVKSPGRLQWLFIGLVFIAAMGVAWRQMDEDYEYRNHVFAGIVSLYFLTWGVWFVVIIPFAITVAIATFFTTPTSRSEDMGDSFWKFSAIGIALLALSGFLFLGMVVDTAYTKEHLSQEVLSNSERLESTEEVPTADPKNARVVPRDVAQTWGVDSLQYSQYTATGGDITYINGTPYWSYSLSPNGIVNTFTKRQIGAVYVNQTNLNRDVDIDANSSFKYGQGMALTDSYSWQVAKQDYLKDYREPFNVPHNGNSKLVVPYVTHEWKFRLLPFPQVYSVPEFSGVKVVHQDGRIEDLSPQEAQQSPILQDEGHFGQTYYPYSLTKLKVSSVAYRNGIVNTFIGHNQQIEISSIPAGSNEQPFTIPVENNKVKYFVATEPWGRANAIRQVWFANPQTGEMQYYQYSKQSGPKSPRRAVDSVMSNPEIRRLSDVNVSEVFPVYVNGELYWQMQIVPGSNARVTYIAFFNANSETTTILNTETTSTDQIRALIAGSSVNNTQPDDRGQIRIHIVTADGQSKTFNVTEGATIEIDVNKTRGNKTQASPSATHD